MSRSFRVARYPRDRDEEESAAAIIWYRSVGTLRSARLSWITGDAGRRDEEVLRAVSGEVSEEFLNATLADVHCTLRAIVPGNVDVRSFLS